MAVTEETKAYEAKMAEFEPDLVRFILNAARSDKYQTVEQLMAAARVDFPECDEAFIRRCTARIGASLS